MEDPRTPVSVTWVGKYKVTIFDQEAYDKSLEEYPTVPSDGKPNKMADPANNKPVFAKQKSLARYNWTTKLDRPLGRIAR